MKNKLTVLFALLLAISTLQAQTQNEIAWKALEQAATPEGQINKDDALVVYNSILESNTITSKEVSIVQRVARMVGPNEESQIIRNISTSQKQGTGVIWAKAIVKYWDKEFTGWTQELVDTRPDLALQLAYKEQAPQSLKTMVFEKIKNTSCSDYYKKLLWKSERAKLDKVSQIQLTENQKQLMIAMTNRGVRENAWLAEVSADLIALQLD